MTTHLQKIFVCYVPGLDQRRISRTETPHLYAYRSQFPMVKIRNQPSTELFPTLITGVNPERHEVWQVSRREPQSPDALARAVDLCPDLLTTTVQGFRQLLDASYDLTTIPARRRRKFDLHRLKYTRRAAFGAQGLTAINGIPTLFQALRRKSKYIFCREFEQCETLLASIPSDASEFEFLEFYALDVFSHWNLDQPQSYRSKLNRTDQFIGDLFEKCAAKGFTFILLVDHGQELVKGRINLAKALQELAVSDEEYLYFIDVAVSRFWFHTARARSAIHELLNSMGNLSVFSYRDLETFDIRFEDSRFGETYAIVDPDLIFFPHDFYQPLTNLYMGMRYKEQRPRLLNPLHRGTHGHVPNQQADEGYMILFDDGFEPSAEHVALIDFAPTIIKLFGDAVAPHMPGRMAFV